MADLQYNYSPIDLSRDAIRVARLEGASTDTDPIRCELFQTFLSETGSDGIPYEALSYTWGDASDQPLEISIDGRALAVGRNLHQALTALRKVGRSRQDRLLWVDAICIDQKNSREKNHQVAQMKRIYSSAETVLIWLGPETMDTRICMRWLDKMQKRVKARADYRRSSVEAWRLEYESVLNVDGDEDTDAAGLRSPQLDGMRTLFGSPWFRRVWVIQEAASARRALILCGRDYVPSAAFTVLSSLLGWCIPGGAQAVLDVMPGPLRELACWWKEARDLSTLIGKFADHEATDPRDGVYALLGLLSDDNRRDVIIQPDYGVSPDVTIARVLRQIMFSDMPEAEWKVLSRQLPGCRVVNIGRPSSDLRANLLGWAVAQRRHPLALVLIRPEYGLDLNAPLPGGNGAGGPLLCVLATRVLDEDAALARAVLDRPGTDVNVVHRSNTPLNLAVQSRSVAMVEVLAENERLDMWHVGTQGCPLRSASQPGPEIEVLVTDEYGTLDRDGPGVKDYTIVQTIVAHTVLFPSWHKEHRLMNSYPELYRRLLGPSSRHSMGQILGRMLCRAVAQGAASSVINRYVDAGAFTNHRIDPEIGGGRGIDRSLDEPAAAADDLTMRLRSLGYKLTPLGHAVHNGDAGAVQTLIGDPRRPPGSAWNGRVAGVAVRGRNRHCPPLTPLGIAVRADHAEVVALLLRSRASYSELLESLREARSNKVGRLLRKAMADATHG